MNGSDRFVLLTTSFSVDDPTIQNANDPRLEAIKLGLEAAIRDAIKGSEVISHSGSWSVYPIGDSTINARRCSKCQRWATDYNQPNQVDVLPWASESEDGDFICLECERWHSF